MTIAASEAFRPGISCTNSHLANVMSSKCSYKTVRGARISNSHSAEHPEALPFDGPIEGEGCCERGILRQLRATALASILGEHLRQIFSGGIRFRSLRPTVETRFERLTISIFVEYGID